MEIKWDGDWNTLSRYFPSFRVKKGVIFSCGRARVSTQLLMERWRQEQRLAHNSTRGGSLCCMDWRTRKGWVCIYLCGILLALLYNKAVWGYASLQWSHALTVDFWQGDAWDVNEGNKPVAISFSKNVWFNAWAKKVFILSWRRFRGLPDPLEETNCGGKGSKAWLIES